MKQIITIEIEGNENKIVDYATIMLLALYQRKEMVMTTYTEETEEQHRKVAIEIERLIDALINAKVKRL